MVVPKKHVTDIVDILIFLDNLSKVNYLHLCNLP